MMVERPLANIADALLDDVTFESDANVIYARDIDPAGRWRLEPLPIEAAADDSCVAAPE